MAVQLRALFVLNGHVVLCCVTGTKLIDEKLGIVFTNRVTFTLPLTNVFAGNVLRFHLRSNHLAQVTPFFSAHNVRGRDIANNAIQSNAIRTVLHNIQE